MSITDLSGIQYFPQLTSLDLNNNVEVSSRLKWNVITDITPMAALTNLTSFSAYNTNLANLNGIQNLTKLGTLLLGGNGETEKGNRISDLSFLSGLTELNFLDISNNRVGDLTPLANLTNLSGLDISKQYIRLPDKPDFDEHNPMSLGPATVNNTVSPHQVALEDTAKPSTPTSGKSFDATTGIMTWDKTMPGDHQYNFNYTGTVNTPDNLIGLPQINFTYSGTFAQQVPGLTVSFDTDGGTPQPADQAHHQNEKVTPPVKVSKPSRYLDGWYNVDTGAKWNFDTDTVTTDMTLKARWKACLPPTYPHSRSHTPPPVHRQ
ncbi:hypothetical protein KIMH_12290 [Bombiscardovia apis]|uniref:Uncharacterized protein n=1 Tax=Bombiscardovia apis TaxID=2932182 RepID=A0ABM8BDZ5_9BIFI|nr:leucine-rich repeat domain-containing protein [Bombiscardovia apis]BDR55118.1 hypothetical protein KIMH_12290 [Bombiscardovia apis]